MFRYIKEYVTCHTCRSPDTILNKETRLFFLQVSFCHDIGAAFRIRIHWVRIPIQHFRLNADPEPEPRFWWPKIGKNSQLRKKFDIFWSKIGITHPWGSIKDVQATGESFTPQKKTSSTSKHKISDPYYRTIRHWTTKNYRIDCPALRVSNTYGFSWSVLHDFYIRLDGQF